MRTCFLCLAVCWMQLACFPGQQGVAQEKVAPQKNRADRVSVQAVAGKVQEDGSQTITVTLSIDEGWYVYAPGCGKELDGVEVKVTAQAKVKPEKVVVDYPAGKTVENPVVDLKVYEGQTVIPFTVWRTKGDTEPLEIKVRYYPANGRTCWRNESKTVVVPFSPASR
jgi:DsbC/DsbD-like thiol-disulfide interchange protein